MLEFVSNLFGLEDKVAVIVGAAGYLCSEMAFSLAKSGASVAILDKNEDRLKVVSDKISNEGGTVISVPLDITEKKKHEEALSIILEKFNGVDVLINGAGINAPTPFLDISLDEWHSILDSHLTGTFFGCQVFGKHMVRIRRALLSTYHLLRQVRLYQKHSRIQLLKRE